MQILKNISLAGYTALRVGGMAESLVIAHTSDDIHRVDITEPHWILGYGTNCLISDEGLPGTVVLMRDGSKPHVEGNLLTADAATNWDELVKTSIEHNLWGLELMSGIPGNAGAALMGNIAAYGQQLAHSFHSATIFDLKTGQEKALNKNDVDFSYRATNLQTMIDPPIITTVTLELSDTPTHELTYASALKVAESLHLKPDSLENCRGIVMETRQRAGSIYDENNPQQEHTAGSFFKNPLVDEKMARYLAGFEEFGRTPSEVVEQSRIHGGDQFRATATHVLLAAGFKRGQSWGAVRLHPKHILKIENTGGATAQQIYDVAQEIISTVKERLGVDLEPEVRFLGKF